MPELNIEVTGVEKLLQNLYPGKASTPDSVPNRVLKLCAKELAPILTFIFNQTLLLGVLPADWKLANITPIFKKGDRHLPENYRPVSLTSVPCKILEHIVCRHIIKHLEEKIILSSLQHMFRNTHMDKSIPDRQEPESISEW